jgi:putative DNA primase/helicase
MQQLTDRARGRWHGILTELGVSPKLLVNRHGPCPLCGGNDRFRFDDKDGRGTWICNHCGAGDGPELIKRLNGVDFKDAAKLVEKFIGRIPKRPSPKPTPAVTRDELNRIWKRSQPIVPGSPAGKYLAGRCGIDVFPMQLREVSNGTPEMIAVVSDNAGKPVTLHRTFLTAEGTKANGAGRSSRKLMPGSLPDSVAIRLSYGGDYVPEILAVAEGIETALSVRQMFGIPCWSLINSVMMQKWNPPDGVKKIIIFGDNDKSFTGQAAAYKLANRLSAKLSVEVKIPEPFGDWNDVHQARIESGCFHGAIYEKKSTQI